MSHPADPHPFKEAWRNRDVDAWAPALAPDVVLYSPILNVAFRGRDAVAELYGVLFERLGYVEITDEFRRGADEVFFWRADVGGRQVEGNELMRWNDAGQISEIKIFIRPLRGILIFAAGVAPAMARKRLRGISPRPHGPS